MREISETLMQAILMQYAMGDKHHELVVPNSTSIFMWEADLISVTRSWFVHEYEIKISRADYLRDSKKDDKHYYLKCGKQYAPNYFWYATIGFDIEPPEHAGWLKIAYDEKHFRYCVRVMREARRLHDGKLSEDKRQAVARLLAWRLANEVYNRVFNRVEATP